MHRKMSKFNACSFCLFIQIHSIKNSHLKQYDMQKLGTGPAWKGLQVLVMKQMWDPSTDQWKSRAVVARYCMASMLKGSLSVIGLFCGLPDLHALYGARILKVLHNTAWHFRGSVGYRASGPMEGVSKSQAAAGLKRHSHCAHSQTLNAGMSPVKVFDS